MNSIDKYLKNGVITSIDISGLFKKERFSFVEALSRRERLSQTRILCSNMLSGLSGELDYSYVVTISVHNQSRGNVLITYSGRLRELEKAVEIELIRSDINEELKENPNKEYEEWIAYLEKIRGL